jgi:hypothetical protein
VDLGAAAIRKLEKNAKKYPKDRVFGSAKKYNEYKEFHSASNAHGESVSEKEDKSPSVGMSNENISLEDLRERMNDFVKNRDWEQVRRLTLQAYFLGW